MKLDCQIPHLLSLWTHTALLYVYHEGGNGNPLQYFHLENIYGQRSLVGYHPKGGKELDRTEWLSSKRSISYEKKQSIFARNYASILDPILDKEDDLNLFRCMLYHSNTRGCHDLVAHWCLSLGNFVDCSSQGSSVHGIFPRQEYWSGLPFTFPSFQFSSVTQSCPTLCDPMNRSTSGPPVHHQLPEFIQTHVHRVGDAIQPSHPLSSPSPPAPNPSQHQGLFQ